MKRVIILAVSMILLSGLAALIIFGVKSAKAKQAGFETAESAVSLTAQAKALELSGNLPAAKKIYQRLMSDFSGLPEILAWQKKIEDLNIRLLFSSAITPKSIAYEIKPGDTLTKIAKQFNTTPQLIVKSNNISGSAIFPGRKIKIWSGPLSIVVDKSQNILMLKSDEEIIKTYVVSTGMNNSTPVGTFKITTKLENPTWFKAGAVIPASSPENVLGTRWLGFDLAGYGIHGTTEPQNLSKQVTQGCVRMANSDVEELYAIIPLATEVTVID